MSELTISVSQLNNYIKNIFDNEEMLIGIKVVGEITNLKPSSRAIYFDLKDENASIPCVVFDESIISSFKFGDKVSAKGKLNFYSKGGKLTFVVSKLEKFGVGDIYRQYLELKERLEKEGLFDESRKKPLPNFARRVGVVSSRTGAVIRDIIRVQHSKNWSADIVLYPVKVQGVGADREIIEGIKFLDTYGVDVIIVARGGGSFEDYEPFNTEQVARAVANAKTPIVSAIGHENDWSIIDFVADRRASTPSVASDMVFYDERAYLRTLAEPLELFLKRQEKSFDELFVKVKKGANSLEQMLNLKLERMEEKVRQASSSIVINIDRNLERKEADLKLLMSSISLNNPMEIMSRGYSKTTVNGKNLTSVKGVKVGDDAEITVVDGTVIAKLTGIKEKK